MRFLADECCPKAIVAALRSAGRDVRYAADTDKSVSDRDLLQIAVSERRLMLTEDFDFGELLIRDQLLSFGAVILFLPQLAPPARAARLMRVLAGPSLILESAITIVEARRIRQRRISA